MYQIFRNTDVYYQMLSSQQKNKKSSDKAAHHINVHEFNSKMIATK